MFHKADEHEARAQEAERLAATVHDPILRDDLLGLARIYRDYAKHLRGRPRHATDAAWRRAVNG
jgi:hypothetical protein